MSEKYVIIGQFSDKGLHELRLCEMLNTQFVQTNTVTEGPAQTVKSYTFDPKVYFFLDTENKGLA